MDAYKTKILFMGTPYFASVALHGLTSAGFSVTSVICRPDEKSGRGGILASPETKIEAEKHKIPVFQPTNKQELIEIVKKIKPELIVVAAYGMIIPKEALDVPKYGILNIHGSLLPKYRGASPITEAILNGDTKTGITIMRMSVGMDEGPIVSSFELQISNEDTTESLTEKMANFGAEVITETIPGWISGELKEIPQDNTKATYCRKITKEDGHIDWDKPALQIERMVRAYQPWPTAYTFTNGLRIKILKSAIENIQNPIGVFSFETGHIYVGTGKGTLEILELQPEGKKPMSAKDFINGNEQFNGNALNKKSLSALSKS
jgi:methionyl-tRNA formyltransferase